MKSILLAGLSFSLSSLAQSASAPTRDKEAVTFNEVERGFYFGVAGGPLFIMNSPAADGATRPASMGQVARFEVGVDIGDRLSVGGLVMGSANRAGADYVGFSGGRASGDYSSFVAGGTARVNLLGFNDAQEVMRTWIYVRGGGGFATFAPKLLLPQSDVLVFAGPGIEYFTRLRHFTVGVEVLGSFLLGTGTIGIALTPNLRYAF